jgi:hypothetical protein
MIAAALALLLTLTQTAPLVQAAQARHLTITTVQPTPLPPGTGSYFYATTPPVVWIGPDYADARPEVLAPELAHELQHADDWANGVLSLAPGEGCFQNERRALWVQAQTWRALTPNGFPMDGSWGVGAMINETIAQVVSGPYFEPWLRQTYRNECA